MTKKDDEAFAAGVAFAFLIPVAVVVLVLPSMFLNGLAASYLWEWFVVPLGITYRLSVVHAMGLALFVHSMTGQQSADKKHTGKELASLILNSMLRPLFILLFGWLVAIFM